MNNTIKQTNRTQKLLISHYQSYPKLQIEDVFKFLFQSSFGCEHLVCGEDMALDCIIREYQGLSKSDLPKTEPLDGEYSRIHLSWLNAGLKAKTLAKLFCLSAKKEPCGKESLENKITIAKELVECGALPLEIENFNAAHQKWRDMEYPAIRHSESFRSEYRPAYRVIANRYAELLDLFTTIDKLSCDNTVNITVAGEVTDVIKALTDILEEVYGNIDVGTEYKKKDIIEKSARSSLCEQLYFKNKCFSVMCVKENCDLLLYVCEKTT